MTTQPEDGLLDIYDKHYLPILRSSIRVGRHLQMYGMLRTGKTRLIERLRRETQDSNEGIIIIALDIHHTLEIVGKGQDKLAAILSELLHQMNFWNNLKTGTDHTPNPQSESGANELQSLLTRSLAQLTWQFKVTWVIDNADAIKQLDDVQKIAFFGFLHNIVQRTTRQDNFTIVQVSQHYLPDLFHGETLTSCTLFIERLTQQIVVKLLNFDQTAQLLLHNAKQAGFTGLEPSDMAESLYRITGGHPYLIRRASDLLFQEGWDLAEEQLFVDQLYKNTRRFFRDVYEMLSDEPPEDKLMSERAVVTRLIGSDSAWNFNDLREIASRSLIQTDIVSTERQLVTHPRVFSPLFEHYLATEVGKDIDNTSVVYISPEKGKVVTLTGREAMVFQYLKERAGKTISHEEIMRAVWEDKLVQQTTLNKVIERLRKKIEVNPSNPQIIVSIYGEGFQFVPAKGIPS